MNISTVFAMGAILSMEVLAMGTITGHIDLFEGIMCDSDKECEEATGYPYDVALAPNPPKYPKYVGIDCEGTVGAPIYAFEEDHLPVCRAIWVMDWEWQQRLVME